MWKVRTSASLRLSDQGPFSVQKEIPKGEATDRNKQTILVDEI